MAAPHNTLAAALVRHVQDDPLVADGGGRPGAAWVDRVVVDRSAQEAQKWFGRPLDSHGSVCIERPIANPRDNLGSADDGSIMQ